MPEPPAVGLGAVDAALLVCAPDGTIVDLNDAAAALLRTERAEAIGRDLAEVRDAAGASLDMAGDVIPRGTAPAMAEAFEGASVPGVVVGLDPGEPGSVTWLRLSAEPLVSPTGVVEAVVMTMVDITAMKATSDALDRAVTDLHELVDTLPDTYVYVDAEDVVGRITGAREPGRGVPRAFTLEGIGESLWSSLSQDAAGKLRQAFALARATGKPVTAEIATITPASVLYDEVRHVPRDDGSLMLIVRDITESRQAAEAVRKSEEKYRTLYLRTPVMLHSIDAEGRLLSVSDRWLQRLDYTADEVLGRHVTEFLTEGSRRKALEESLPRFFATGAVEDLSEQMVTKDGDVVDVLLSATSERDSSGHLVRSLAVLVDVTEQRRTARQLVERDRTMDNLLANIPGMAYRCAADDDWSLLVLSQGCADLTGYTAAELVGDGGVNYGGLIDPAERIRLRAQLEAALAEDRPWTVTYRLTTRGGERKWVWERGRGVFAEDGRVDYIEGFVSDITELHEAEEALREREQMLSAVVASLPGAVYRSELREPWRTAFLSEGFRALQGVDPDLVTSGEVRWKDFVHPDDAPMLDEDIERDLAQGSPTTQSEYRIVTAGGETRWVLDRAMFVRDETGEPVEPIGMLFDVTDLHGALEAREESERRLRTVVDNLPGMVYRSQAVAPWSDEFIAGGDVSVTGYSVDELTDPAFRWDRVMHPQDVPLLEAASQAGAETGRGEAEYRIYSKDGSERWLLDRFSLLRDERGEPLAQEGILLDVTEQHLIADELRDSRDALELHARVATVFLSTPSDRTFVDALGVVREAMGARWGFFGYLAGDGALVLPSTEAGVWDACEIEGKPQRFPRHTWSENTWSRAIRTGRTQCLEGRGSVPQGHVEITRAVSTPIVHGGETIGVFIVAERDRPFGDDDVRVLEDLAATAAPILHEWRERVEQEAARREAERALRESEQRYRSLYDGSPAGVFVFDGDLTFLDCNAAFEEIFGAPASHYAGRRIPDIVVDDRILGAIETAVRGGEGFYQGSYTSSLGRSLWMTLKTAPRYDADGAVAGGTGVFVDRTSQKASEEQVRHLLLHDPASGLANRSLLEERVGQALKHARRKRLSLALAAFRVDRFDTVESSLGHTDVDLLLRELGRRLQQAGRAEDTVAYLGGGAFAALLPGASGPVEASAAVSGLRSVVSEPLLVADHELFLTVSLGVSLYPTDGTTTAELLRNADAAMRQASDAGGDGWQFFHPGLKEARAGRLELDAELHRALEGDQFFLEYQPLVAAATEEIVGMEALVRWRHPKRGVLLPLDFIPVAEDTGMLTRIGEWILQEACRQGRLWHRQVGRPLRMAVNMSARQLHDETHVDMVRRTLRATGFDARALELEITETAAMRDARHTAQILGALRKMGVRVALDDFGTGYSSLSHLVRLPISTVKIDRSFVHDLLTVPEHAAVAASVIALGHRLGLTVAAEGVETIGERGVLRDEGCDVIQGFLYSPAVPAEDLTESLRAGTIPR